MLMFGEPRDRREDVAAARVAEGQRRRHLDVRSAGRGPAAAGRAPARSASAARSCLRARRRSCARSLLRVARSSSSMSPLRRVQLGGELVLDQRLVELAGRGEPAAAVEVILRGAQLGALEREPRVGVVGLLRGPPWCIRRPRGRSPGAARRRGRGCSAPDAAQPPATAGRAATSDDQAAPAAQRPGRMR